MTQPLKGRPGVKYDADADLTEESQGSIIIESGVNGERHVYVRMFIDGVKTVMDEETAWTLVRMLVGALGAAEGDRLVYGALSRMIDEDTAGRMLVAMREERGRTDLSDQRQHFYRRVTEGRPSA